MTQILELAMNGLKAATITMIKDLKENMLRIMSDRKSQQRNRNNKNEPNGNAGPEK